VEAADKAAMKLLSPIGSRTLLHMLDETPRPALGPSKATNPLKTPPRRRATSSDSPHTHPPPGHIRLGVIGLAEYAWLETLTTLSLDQLMFEPASDCAARLSGVLRDRLNCDLVIALAHMRLPNDRALAFEAQEHVDVILGGHDHDMAFELCGTVPVVKTGTEFWWLSEVELDLESVVSAAGARRLVRSWGAPKGDFGAPSAPMVEPDSMLCPWGWGEGHVADPVEGLTIIPSIASPSERTVVRLPRGEVADVPRSAFRIRLFEVRAVAAIPPDPVALASVKKWQDSVESTLNKVIGESSVPLDARFSEVRTRETNIGSLLCDLMREAVHADCAILNGGTIRANCIIHPGTITLRDLVALLPMQDPVVKLKITGDQLVRALENGVSKWPDLEGRFPQVSGIRFSFDPSKPPGERVDVGSIRIRGKFLVSEPSDDFTGIGPSGESVSESSGTSTSGVSEMPRLTPPAALNLRRHHEWDPPEDEGRTSGAAEAASRAARRCAIPETTGLDDGDDIGMPVDDVPGTPRPGNPSRLLDPGSAERRALELIMAGGDAPVEHGISMRSAQPEAWRDKELTIATKAYLASGRDGYTALAEGAVLIDDENGPIIPTLLRQHFAMLEALNGLRSAYHHSVRRKALRVLRRALRRLRHKRMGRQLSSDSLADQASNDVSAGLHIRSRRVSVAEESSRADGMLPEWETTDIPEGCSVPFTITAKVSGRIKILGAPAEAGGV
jgi:hypothetical protein